MPEPDLKTLERRLEAVERAVAGGDRAPEPEVQPPAPDDQLTDRIDALEVRLEELDAALQAVRGFLGGVDAVNEDVEARADAALAAIERLERRIDGESMEMGDPSLEPRDERATVEHDTSPSSESDAAPLGERLEDQW